MIPLTKEKHFAQVGETSRIVWPILERAITTETEKLGMECISPHLEILLARRRGKNLLRPYVARIVATLGDEEWTNERTLRLLAATEALNLSTYYSNFAFDSKAGISGQSDCNGQFVCSMILLGVAESLVDSALSSDFNRCKSALSQLRNTNLSVYAGQHLDLHILTHSQAHRFNKEDFIRRYFSRCSQLCGSTFQLCLMSVHEEKFPQDVLKALNSILLHLGAGIQAINDLADFIPTSERNYADSYSDLLNGRLTLPSYLLASSGVSLDSLSSSAREALQTPEKLRVFSDSMRGKMPVNEVRQFVFTQCWIPIRQHLRFLRKRLAGHINELSDFDFIPHLFFESRLFKFFDSASTQYRQ